MKLNFKNTSFTIFIVCASSLISTETLAAKDIESLAITCGACHGADGIAANNEWPSLAGQKPGYLLDQLKAFKNGSRQNVLMENQLTNFSEQDLSQLAEYYSSLPFIKPEASTINKEGQNVRSACLSCHGKKGKTVNDEWPNLAGQNKGYLFQQLKDYSSHKRDSMIMNVIANELNEQQMKAVAEYYEQVGSEQ